MEHEILLRLLVFHGIDELRVARTAEREYAEHVGRTAVEEARTVYDRREASCLCQERSDFVHGATIGAAIIFDRLFVNVIVDVFFVVIIEESRFDIRELRHRSLYPFALERVHFLLPDIAVIGSEYRFFKLWNDEFGECGLHFGRNRWRHEFLLRHTAISNDHFLPCLDLLDLFGDRGESFFERLFRYFVCTHFDHIDEAVFAAREEVHARPFSFALFICRIHNECACCLSLFKTHCRDGTVPRNVRCSECQRCGIDREHVGVVVLDREHRDDDLHIALEPCGKQRAYGAVDDAAREYRFF